MSKNKIPGGDSGGGSYEDMEQLDITAYRSYKAYMDDCDMTHEEALDIVGYSNDEIQQLKIKFEPTTAEDESK